MSAAQVRSAAADWKIQDVRHHDREATFYDRLIGREYAPYQRTHTADVWGRLFARSTCDVALDVGAGTGRTAIPIALAGTTVIALDTSRGMLAVLRGKARRAGLRRVWVVIGDAERLPFASGAIAAVACQGVLHHLPDVEGALAEADRVLAAGGWLCVAEPDTCGSRLSRLVRAIVSAIRPVVRGIGGRRSPATAHERSLDARAMLRSIARSGYDVSAEFLVHPPYIYRLLPAALADLVAGGLNAFGSRHRSSGDIVVVRARKRAAGTDA